MKDLNAPSRSTPDTHLRGEDKLARARVTIEPQAPLRKPEWIRIRPQFSRHLRQTKQLLREQGLRTVCEEAACPNLGECFHKGTATFMIMGDICTRRCPFCDVAHGKPAPLDADEPARLAAAIQRMQLGHVVITSVDRDDLRDGGAGHFAACVRSLRDSRPATRIEILVPDFRGRLENALTALRNTPPDVFNHNLETVPRLYPQVRPGADYRHSLRLLDEFKRACPSVITKSGLMLGVGETLAEVRQVMEDLRQHRVEMLTLGQYLQPGKSHLPVQRYVPPAEFADLQRLAEQMGFRSAACGPFVRSSYHAEQQAANTHSPPGPA